jgi:2-oxoglutarate ferredoxin oxidoreductase subunit gamma
MRGGTANCTVVIADEEIGSPVVKNPDLAIVMNLPSLDKYESLVKPGGWLVVNESMVDRTVRRKDITAIAIPCNKIAEEIGSPRLANMVAIGALMVGLNVLTIADLETALNNHMPGRHKQLLPKNVEALKKGAEFAADILQK